MCNSTVHHRPPSANFNGIVDPFSFSTFHLLSTCNRLILPTELQSYYSLMKDNNSKVDDQNVLESTQKSELQHPEIKTIFPTIVTGSKDLHHSSLPAAATMTIQHNPPTCPTLENDYSKRDYPLTDINRVSSYAHFLSRRQRGEKRPIPDEQKDEKYYERRKRNNEAAKKSRDARKIREDRIAFRASLLEQENAILRAQSIALREEVARLRQIMGSSNPTHLTVNL